MQLSVRAHRSPRALLIATAALAMLATLLVVATTAAPVAAQPNASTCYSIADLGGNNQGTTDDLLRITGGAVALVGPLGTNDAEAFAIRPGDTGYAWSGADGLGLVTVDLASGATADAPFDVGGVKVEGLTWANTADADLDNDILYVVRVNGAVEGFTPGGAAAGITANIATADFPEGTDIAWDPVDDLLYAIRTDDSAAGDMTQVVSIDDQGTVTLVGASAVDLEGLGFDDAGSMIGTTGDDGGDDLYEVSQANGAVGAALADLSSNIDNEDVDCRTLEIAADPGVLSATIASECGAPPEADGKVTATITYDSGTEPADYSVAITGQAVQVGTLNAGDAPVMVMSPPDLADGAVTITVTNTTEDVVLVVETLTIACDDPGMLGASIANSCVADDGVITVTVNYVTGTDPVDYTVTVQGAAPQVGTLAAGDPPAELTFGALPDGAYIVLVNDSTNMVEVGSATVDIVCDPTEPPTASAEVVCVEGLGEVTVTMLNPTGSVVDFVTTVLGVEETESLNPAPTALVNGDVVINEFMADNESTLVDGDGAFVDWIELYNPTAAAIDITGWSITDDAADPTKQVFPLGTTIGADGYLYVFNGDGAFGPAGPTFNFGLSNGGEYLGLYDDQGAVVSEYSPAYPDQFTDISYGLGSDGTIGYFETPSGPGAEANGVPTSTVPMATDSFQGLPDGMVDIVVTANGTEIAVANSPVTVACDTGEVTVDVAAVCVGNDGRILTTYNNTSQQSVDLVVSFSQGGGPDQSVTIAPGQSGTLTRTGRTDRAYTVSYTIDGGAPAAVAVTVDCDPAMVENPALTLQLNVNGADANAAPGPAITDGAAVNYTYLVTNSGDVTLTNVTVTDDSGLPIDCENGGATIASLAAQASVTCTASTTAVIGLVTVSATASGTSPANATVTDTDPANYTGQLVALGDITFTFENVCVGGNGAFYFDVTNATDTDAMVVLAVSGLPDRMVTVPAGATVTVARTGRPDNTYVVELTINGQSALTSLEQVNCDNDLPPGTGEIGDLVFNDVNGDGIQSAGDTGIPGVTVNLWTDDDNNGTPDTQIDSTVTDGSGLYRFIGLDVSNTYVVQFVPGARTFSPSGVGSAALDSNPDATGVTGPINLSQSEFNNTIDAGLIDAMGDVTSVFFNECVAGNGSLYVLVTNNTAGPVPAQIDVTGLPTRTTTIAPGATTFVGRTGRPDGTYQVTAVVDGVTVIDSLETVACDAPPPVTTESIGLALELSDGPTANIDGNFELKYTYKVTNTGSQPVTVTSIDDGLAAGYAGAFVLSQVATMDLCTGSTLAVAASCTAMIEVTVDVLNQPGPFLVSATVMGVAADGDPVSDVSTNGTNVDPDADGPENNSDPTPAVFPGFVTFTLNNTCLSGNGAFIYFVTNATLTPVIATLEVGTLAPKSVQVAPQSTMPIGISGRPDNTYPVTLSIDGAIVDMANRDVTCDVEFGRGTAVISEPQCSGATETVFVSLEHLSGDTNVDFVITVDGVDQAPISLAPGDPAAIITLGALSDGAHTISVTGDGVESVTKTITIAELDCFSVASVEGVCIDASQGVIRVTLDNPTGAPVPYVIETTDGVTTAMIEAVAPAGAIGIQVDESTFFDDGAFDVVVSALGVELFNGTVGLACGTPQLTAEAFFVECEQANDGDFHGNVAVDVTYLAGEGLAQFEIEWDTGVVGSLVRGIREGTRRQLVRLLLNGPVTITVTDITNGANTVLVTEVINIDCNDPGITATASAPACVSGRGEVNVDLSYLYGTVDATYSINWENGAQTGSTMGTVTDAATVTETIGAQADGDLTITVVNTTNGRMDTVETFVVPIACEDPVLMATVMFAQCEAGGGEVTVMVTLVGGDGPATYQIEWTAGGVTDTLDGAVSNVTAIRTITALPNGPVAFTVTNTTGTPIVVDTEVIDISCP